MKLGRLPKLNAPLGDSGSFRWPKANDERKRDAAATPPFPKAGVGEVGDEVSMGFLLPVKAIDGTLGNEISEVLLLVVKIWLGNAFCCRPCW